MHPGHELHFHFAAWTGPGIRANLRHPSPGKIIPYLALQNNRLFDAHEARA